MTSYRRSGFRSVSGSGSRSFVLPWRRRVPLPVLVVMVVLATLLVGISGRFTAGALAPADPGAVFVDNYANGWLGNPDLYRSGVGTLSRPVTPAWDSIGLTHAGGPTVAYTQVSFDIRSNVEVAVGLTASSAPATSPTSRKTAAASSWVRVSCSFTAMNTSWAWYNLGFYTVGVAGSIELDNIELGTGGPATDTCATVAVPSTTVSPGVASTVSPSSLGAVWVDAYANGWLGNPDLYRSGVGTLSRPSSPAWEGIGLTHGGGPSVAYTQVSFDIRSNVEVAVGVTASSAPATSPTSRKTAASSSWVRVSCSFTAMNTSWAWYNLNFYTVGVAGSIELDNIELGTGGPLLLRGM
jgi:hypothetical protein